MTTTAAWLHQAVTKHVRYAYLSRAHTPSNPPCSRISTVIVKIECDRLDSLFMRVLATLRFFCPTLPELAATRVKGTSKRGAMGRQLLRCLHNLLEVGGTLHDHVRQVFHEHTSLWMVFQLEFLLRIFREQISDPGSGRQTRVQTGSIPKSDSLPCMLSDSSL